MDYPWLVTCRNRSSTIRPNLNSMDTTFTSVLLTSHFLVMLMTSVPLVTSLNSRDILLERDYKDLLLDQHNVFRMEERGSDMLKMVKFIYIWFQSFLIFQNLCITLGGKCAYDNVIFYNVHKYHYVMLRVYLIVIITMMLFISMVLS